MTCSKDAWFVKGGFGVHALFTEQEQHVLCGALGRITS